MLVFLLESLTLLGTAINCGYTITHHLESFTLKNLISYLTISVSIIFYFNQNETSYWLLIPLVLLSLTLLVILDARPAILNLLLGLISITSLYFTFVVFLNSINEQLLNHAVTYILFFILVNASAIILRLIMAKKNIQIYQEQFWHQNMNKGLALIIGSFSLFYIFSGNLKKSIIAWPLTILQSVIILVISVIIVGISFLFLQHERQIQTLKETAVNQQASDLQLYLNTLKASRHEYNAHLNTIHQLLHSNQLEQLNDNSYSSKG